jgi:serine/threonine protein kinase
VVRKALQSEFSQTHQLPRYRKPIEMKNFVLDSLPEGYKHIKTLPQELQGAQSQVDLVEDENGVTRVSKTVYSHKFRPIEAEVLQPITPPHPYIVSGFVSKIAKTHAQFILEYCPHSSLHENDELDFIDKVIVLRQLAVALIECHKRQIIHADIKPENILVYSLSPIHIKLCDFGLSFHPDNPPLGPRGTYETMSPEMISSRALSTLTDIWSYGTTAYEIITNYTPFGTRRNMSRMNGKILSAQISWINEHDCVVLNYDDFKDFISRLLRVNPRERMSLKDALTHPFLNPWRRLTHTFIHYHNMRDLDIL